MTLTRFQRVAPPLSAAKIKEVTGTNYSFRGTMFSVDSESADAILKHIGTDGKQGAV